MRHFKARSIPIIITTTSVPVKTISSSSKQEVVTLRGMFLFGLITLLLRRHDERRRRLCRPHPLLPSALLYILPSYKVFFQDVAFRPLTGVNCRSTFFLSNWRALFSSHLILSSSPKKSQFVTFFLIRKGKQNIHCILLLGFLWWYFCFQKGTSPDVL